MAAITAYWKTCGSEVRNLSLTLVIGLVETAPWQCNPLTIRLNIGPFHGSPSGAMGDLLLLAVSRVGSKGMVESFAIYVLRMCGQMITDRKREIGI